MRMCRYLLIFSWIATHPALSHPMSSHLLTAVHRRNSPQLNCKLRRDFKAPSGYHSKPRSCLCSFLSPLSWARPQLLAKPPSVQVWFLPWPSPGAPTQSCLFFTASIYSRLISFQPWHQNLVFLTDPTQTWPPTRSTCHSIEEELDWSAQMAPLSYKTLGGGEEQKGFPNPEQWRVAVWATPWGAHGLVSVEAVAKELVQNHSKAPAGASLHFMFSVRPHCLGAVYNCWHTGPYEPPRRLVIGYYL